MHREFTLDVSDVEMLARVSQDDRIVECCHAWLAAYDLGLWMGFSQATAQRQAAAAWDRMADDIAELMCPAEPAMN